ncbi:hypothetical protein GTQ99_05820 [Kineococcus sp. T13]|uniref:hypothetical protein n=1 Tax=Kineococcus vitellinus TaxID=2696565 RepID=UPI001412700A|nr:hypothetical protein [Kineococcus vitellinus]NAZ74941.1 hypothetical protein [Kineococcus vitellinus]
MPVRDLQVMDGGWLLLRGGEREVELPANFYLQEMGGHGPRQEDEVIAFVQRWGRCADPYWRDRPPGYEWAEGGAEAAIAARQGAPFAFADRSCDRAAVAARFAVVDERDLVHVEEVKDRCAAVHQLVTLVQRWSEGAEPSTVEEDLFVEFVNGAMTAFSPGLTMTRGPRSVSLPHITAYSVSVLQLYNDLVLQLPIRRCANERCPHGGFFTRQRGRTQYGQHRTSGTKYCSAECAKSQAERERRRRRSKETR